MKSRVNLVAILLTLGCVARVLEGLKSDEKHASQENKEYPLGRKIVKEVHNKVASSQSAALLRVEDKTKIVKSKNTGFGLSKDYSRESGNVLSEENTLENNCYYLRTTDHNIFI